MKKVTKKQMGLIAAVVLLGVGGTYAYVQNQSSVKAAEAKKEVKATTDKLDGLNTEINALYDKKDPDFLVKGIKTKQITDLQKKVTKETTIKKEKNLSKKDYTDLDQKVELVNTNIKKAKKAMEALIAINGLYQQTQTSVAINGSVVKKDLAIVDDLKKETVENVNKAFFKEGATKTYDKTINELISNAEKQLNQIDTSKAAVAKVFKEGKIISIDNKLYDVAKSETDKIKNEKAKKALLDQLAKVKSDIDKKAEEEAEKVAADQTAQQQAQAQSQVKQEEQAVVDPTTQQATNEQNQGSQSPTYAGGNTEYQAPASTGEGTGAGYQPPATNGGGAGVTQPPATAGNGQGVMTQAEGDKAAEDASTSDWSQFFPNK
ncbi:MULTISPECIES: hypothetical protein [unclassified Enterococcus]|uniref:hypothetical protein n=1 Tax=unclassified Enterococcus TaxID=2608891 RepID=UPI001CE1EF66|nr:MULTISPECIES: hypothetical protein [unclassified Enterococcus]MCA5014550.1 hypothetical protein [Enterococcus sp. S23]MCA5017803.1 hypothetical protein [Enterococcus sp. S22(2020)]